MGPSRSSSRASRRALSPSLTPSLPTRPPAPVPATETGGCVVAPGGSGAHGCSSCTSSEARPHAELQRLILRGDVGRYDDVRRQLLDAYGRYIPQGARHHPIRVYDRASWVRLLVMLGTNPDADILGLFFPIPQQECFYGIQPSVLVPEGATPHVVFHELVHAYTHERFWGMTQGDASQDIMPAFARTFAFRESWTETLTRKAGHVASQALAYDDDVRRIRHMGGSPGDAAERAVFQGDVTALLAHVSHNLDTSENALGGARNLWEAWSGHREGPSFERDPGIPRE